MDALAGSKQIEKGEKHLQHDPSDGVSFSDAIQNYIDEPDKVPDHSRIKVENPVVDGIKGMIKLQSATLQVLREIKVLTKKQTETVMIIRDNISFKLQSSALSELRTIRALLSVIKEEPKK